MLVSRYVSPAVGQLLLRSLVTSEGVNWSNAARRDFYEMFELRK
jgi:hypothetical protein